MADLPDYYTQTAISEAEAASFKGGLDANKSAAPVSRQIYYATDSKILYVCVVDGAWININALYLLLAGGTMTGNIVMGGHKLTGLGAPTAQNNSLRYGQAEIRNNEIAAAAAIAYTKLALTGLIRNADIKSDAAIVVSKLVNTYFPETLMTAQGDILVRGADNPQRLAKITTDQVLQATATGYQGVALPTARTIATGNYTGNDGNDRQITVGFKCSMVVILGDSESIHAVIVPSRGCHIDDGFIFTGGTALHGTDGFVVSYTTDTMNAAPSVYYYWAISE